ncbi:MAG TPA: epoxide hydrolase [Candidatus Limnocylindrales bacterium]
MTASPISDEITEYRIEIPDEDVADLNRRITQTRWPRQLPGTGWERGVPVDYLRDLASHWTGGYSWRDTEARLNAFPQFKTVIDGAPIHFVHVRSPHPQARPLILTHGYPSSFVEFAEVITPLAHPDDPDDAFHVVVPSLPGYGFSGPLEQTGWTLSRTAHAWAELMRRLGYDRYFAHGTDIGAGVTGMLGSFDSDHAAALHVCADPTSLALLEGMLPNEDDSFTDEERERLEHWRNYGAEGRGYLHIQRSKPQTLAYGLNDSPVAQLAWMAEKFEAWTGPTTRVDREALLTEVSIFWYTSSGVTAAHSIYEAAHSMDWPAPSTVPQGWSIFGSESLLRRALNPDGKIEHFTEHEAGGHFPALEVPDLLVEDIRDYFREYRQQ